MNRRLAALDFITSCLGVRSDSDINCALRSIIASGHLDWPAVIEIANIQLVTPALWVALRNRGLIEDLPADVCRYLQELHRLNTVRNEHLKAQLIEVVSRLNAIGIEPMLLKGSVSLFIDMFDDPGSRVMADLDILVPQERAKDCWNLLRRTLGYFPSDPNADLVRAGRRYIDYSRLHHLRPLFRRGEYASVEIHREALREKLTGGLLPTKIVWEQAEIVNESGVEIKIPALINRILLNLLHSNLQDRNYERGNISLRSLHELAVTQAVFHERIDWKSIQKRMDHGNAENALFASLYLCHRLFGCSLPDGIRPTTWAVAHYARTRLQFRWDWTEKVMDRALWFSAQDICRRYGCNNSFVSLTRGRAQLAASLSGKYSRQALGWVKRQL